MMRFSTDQDRIKNETRLTIATRPQIAVAPPTSAPELPAGFDDVDLAILDWIVAEQIRAIAS
jgi:hypothetical protein